MKGLHKFKNLIFLALKKKYEFKILHIKIPINEPIEFVLHSFYFSSKNLMTNIISDTTELCRNTFMRQIWMDI